MEESLKRLQDLAINGKDPEKDHAEADYILLDIIDHLVWNSLYSHDYTNKVHNAFYGIKKYYS